MWDWNHLKGEGWLRHSMRAAQMAGLLLLSGAAMLLHVLLPFWKQPKFLRAEEVAQTLMSRALARAITTSGDSIDVDPVQSVVAGVEAVVAEVEAVVAEVEAAVAEDSGVLGNASDHDVEEPDSDADALEDDVEAEETEEPESTPGSSKRSRSGARWAPKD